MMREKGQSTIEFLFSFIFVVLFVFLFLRVSMNYTAGFLVHYATFMASRAYLVNDNNSNDTSSSDGEAARVAKDVFESYKANLFLNISQGPSFSINAPTEANYLFVGPYAEYSQKFGMGMLGTGDVLRFRSESFLGREPSKKECAEQVCAAMRAIISTCDDENLTIFDNGC